MKNQGFPFVTVPVVVGLVVLTIMFWWIAIPAWLLFLYIYWRTESVSSHTAPDGKTNISESYYGYLGYSAQPRWLRKAYNEASRLPHKEDRIRAWSALETHSVLAPSGRRLTDEEIRGDNVVFEPNEGPGMSPWPILVLIGIFILILAGIASGVY